ncbi:MAG: DUF262 domain-containing protein [Muribaculaceae bacterium]|nr:DUF262 domain-containing protein [Muribaculaceae bacterium]
MAENHSENLIDQKAIGDLLGGYVFHIPPYQRGYRWTKQEVVDLCNDLLEYANRPASNGSKSFYSLQPLVVKPRPDGSFDVIDGQQRLTTIYILYRFLMSDIGPGANKHLPYSIIYDTRPEDTEFIAQLGSDAWEDKLNQWNMDIDMAHIYNAYHYMKECISDHDKEKLRNLLKNKKSSKATEGNAQFIWYQLAEDRDGIGEFIVENKGKIGLTEIEKIRSMFLYRKNKHNEVEVAQQIRIAKDWDEIETTLHDQDFWSFISSDYPEEGRMGIILKYIFNKDKAKDDTDTSNLYKFYEDKFAKQDGNVANREWERILDAFRMLKNWYKDAILYNIIGLLTREGVSLNQIAEIYYSEDIKTTSEFVSKLKEIVNSRSLPKLVSEVRDGIEADVKIGPNEKFDIATGELYLDLNYLDHKDKVRSLLLFLNILVLNEQIENHRITNHSYSGNEYRFAFNLFDNETWDIEHIDSTTINPLKSSQVQQRWLQLAEVALKHYYQQEYTDFIIAKAEYETGIIDFDTLHKRVIEITHSESSDEEMKNWIGNLTLLNSNINRGYGNAIFAVKCSEIDRKVNAGAFVPVCTRMVFYKAIPNNDNAASRLDWNFTDKKAYHNWILKKILDFKNNLRKEN